MDAHNPKQLDPRPKAHPASAETDHEAPKTVIWSPLDPAPVAPLGPRTDWPSGPGGDRAEPPRSDPRAGDQILGFTLIERIGRGTFANVFLAEQEAIAGRRVVLKITNQPTPEPERLGRLQHPNVVPIHSVHRAPPHELICMPYLGRTTLADLLATERRRRDPSYSTFLAPTGSPPPPAPATASPERAGAAGHRGRDPLASPLADVRWVLRSLSDLAAGLDHAHRRGILHLDIKPANVLIADTGEPMLLDFNLSHDTTKARELVGGTIPYTAPEQLAEIITHTRGQVDERTDLYGLGALAYELFTAEQAFPTGIVSRAELEQYLEDRRKSVPSVRAKNAAVSPAVDSIVRKLLAPDPADRYQTARELKTDIDRHLADLPLVSAPDRSARERLAKWRRRNPWVPLRLAMAAVVGLALALGITLRRQGVESQERTAVAQAWAVQAGMPALRIDLTAPGDSGARARGRARAEEHLAKYGLPDDPRWRDRRPFARLPEGFKAEVAADLGELLLLLAHARGQDAKSAPESEREALARASRHLNRLAEGCFAPESVPPFLHAQRARLAAALGEQTTPPESAEPKHPRDHYLEAVGLIAAGRYHTATRALERVISGDPGHAAAHFALATCRHQLGQYARALERYDTAHVLLPKDPRPAYYRGLVFGTQGKVGLAEAEFTLAITIDPTHGESHRKRAGVRMQVRKYREAEEDLTTALKCGVPALQVYLLRAQVRTLLDDHRGAEGDRHSARSYKPESEADFVTRGRTRLPDDPKGALADYVAAAGLNPRSLAALQSQAHVLSELLKDDARALEVVSRAAEFYPEYAPARAGRAVLLARIGKREEAHRESEAALAVSDDSMITYQLAGVFALTSPGHPADTERAFTLLRQAVRDGFRDARTLDTDPDLKPIRHRPEFATISRALTDLNR